MSLQGNTSPRLREKWWLVGKKPDYRFTLANDRTFLAWIRTALALLAGAVGIDQFSPQLSSPTLRLALALLLVLSGTVLAVVAWYRWRGNEHAMRLDGELPYTRFLLLSAGCVFLVAVLLTILLCQGQP